MSEPPKILIIAGPNGADKTTFAREFLPHEANCLTFVNADLIAAGLSPFQPETAALRAGRIMLEEIKSHVLHGTSLCPRIHVERHHLCPDDSKLAGQGVSRQTVISGAGEPGGSHHPRGDAGHSLATLAYLIERQASAAQARACIGGLLGWAQVAPTMHTDAVLALSWPMPDFEDALQAAAARACGARFIITRNERDFLASPVVAMTPESFLGQHFAT